MLPAATPNRVACEVTIAVAADPDAPVRITVSTIAPEDAIAKRDAAIRAATVPTAVPGVVTINKLGTFLVGP